MSIQEILETMEDNANQGAQSIDSLLEQHIAVEAKAQHTVETDISAIKECLNGLCSLSWRPAKRA